MHLSGKNMPVNRTFFRPVDDRMMVSVSEECCSYSFKVPVAVSPSNCRASGRVEGLYVSNTPPPSKPDGSNVGCSARRARRAGRVVLLTTEVVSRKVREVRKVISGGSQLVATDGSDAMNCVPPAFPYFHNSIFPQFHNPTFFMGADASVSVNTSSQQGDKQNDKEKSTQWTGSTSALANGM